MTAAPDASAPVEPDVDEVLDNPEWFALNGPHAHLAVTCGRAVRYPPDVTIFGAMANVPGSPDPDAAAWADLAELVGPGGWVVVKWTRPDPPPPPEGWTTVVALGGNQMVLPDAERLHAEARRVTIPQDLTIRDLGTADVGAMTDLVRRTDPGPFERRTIEMGRYLGAFAGDRLVARAGVRVHPPGHTEISAVCTDADVRGLGLATALVRRVADGIIERGETPYLNVADGNDNARALYERLGFQLRRRLAFRSVRWQ